MHATKHLTGNAATGAAILTLTLAGCGSSGSSGSGGSAGTPAAVTTGTTLMTAKVAKVGTVVTDSKGYVLYRFDADSAHPTRVSCYGTCAVVWPAATAKGSVTVKGIDKSLVSTVKRSGGTSQLTLAGWPLYRYAKDDQPKEAYGQGVGGTWWAVTPTGAKATTATASSTGGGY
jgi:predicted lipoprotein with Yx(FWY)xxD motif